MRHRIVSTDSGSIAKELEIESGSWLISIDGEDIVDIIDYEALCSSESLLLCYESPDGELVEAEIEKEAYEPLGLNFADDLINGMRSCKNHCLFCFIDQMPRKGRRTLQFKDDDWRMSIIMGNYVTLTNVSDGEFERILRRRASPLYISVHTLDPEIRIKMMANPTAGLIVKRLERLKSEGLRFHSQIVLCPGINDGEALDYTLDGLSRLYPYAQSVAIVPVGLTKHRGGLYPLRCLSAAEAERAILQINAVQDKMRGLYGVEFAYASDEMYMIAGTPLPAYDSYGDFVQLENGVGMLRKFEREFMDELSNMQPLESELNLDAVSGTSAFNFLKRLFKRLKQHNININLHAVKNDYFGDTVTVSGLVCGCDIVNQLRNRLISDKLILPSCMLRENDDVFLDGMRISDVAEGLKARVLPVCSFDGGRLIEEIFKIN